MWRSAAFFFIKLQAGDLQFYYKLYQSQVFCFPLKISFTYIMNQCFSYFYNLGTAIIKEYFCVVA